MPGHLADIMVYWTVAEQTFCHVTPLIYLFIIIIIIIIIIILFIINHCL